MVFFLEAQIQQKNNENKMRTKIYINYADRKITEYYFKLRLRTGSQWIPFIHAATDKSNIV